MRPSLARMLAPPVLLAVLALAPFAVAQTGGGALGPVGGAVAAVEYQVNQTLNGTAPGNGTTPPSGNTTTPPSGNTTTPPSGNTTTPPTGNPTPPSGNGTTPPGGNGTAPGTGPGGNNTTPGNGTAPDNSTAPPGGNSTTPGNGTAPPGNGTAPPGNSTSPPDNSTVAPGNETLGGSGTGSAEKGPGWTDSGMSRDEVPAEEGPVDLGTAEEELGLTGGYEGCLGHECERSRTPDPVQAGFPWLPLLITLLLGPLVGLVVARQAVKRWEVARPARRGVQVKAGPKGPPDALDPMRAFLKDVQEWKAIPQPGSAPADANASPAPAA